MTALTATQAAALAKFQPGEIRCAYGTASLATLRALVKKGYLRDVTPTRPGAMFSPTTHYQFTLTSKEHPT